MSRWSVRIDRSDRDHGSLEAPVADAQEFVITESLGYLVNRAARLMAQQLAQELRPARIGIGQWAVLLPLWARDDMSQAELSRVVAIEPPTMVRTIDRMVRDGLVTRVPDPDDGRLSRIHLTERGRSLRDELIPKAIAVNAATLERLTPAEGRTLQRLLGKLVSQPDGDAPGQSSQALRLEHGQRAAGTRRVREREHVRSRAGTGGMPLPGSEPR